MLCEAVNHLPPQSMHLSSCVFINFLMFSIAAPLASTQPNRTQPRLNTCISSRNYVHFYLLGVSGSLLYGYMVAIGILVQFLVDEDDLRDGFGSLVAGRWSWGIFDVMSGWIAFSFVALAGFHSYLLCIGMGTYDWVVLQVRWLEAFL